MLVPGSEFEEPGEELQLGMDSMALYPAFIEELRQASGGAIDFAMVGTLEIGADEADLERLKVRAAKQRAFGVPSMVLDATELRSRFSGFSRALAGAVYYPEEGQVDPRTVTAALRQAFRNLPVTVLEGNAIREVRIAGDSVEALSANGDRLTARRAILAAGAWTTQIQLPFSLPRAYPIKGHLLGYRGPAPGSMPHVLRFHETYLVQRQSGYTIAGTSVEDVGFDRSLDPRIIADIEKRAHGLAGGLLPESSTGQWVGFRPAVESPLPLVGRHEDSPLYLAYGHFRNGILWAPLTAERLAAALTSTNS